MHGRVCVGPYTYVCPMDNCCFPKAYILVGTQDAFRPKAAPQWRFCCASSLRSHLQNSTYKYFHAAFHFFSYGIGE